MSSSVQFPKSVHGFILFLGQFTTTLVLCTIEAKLVSKLHIRCIRRYSRYLADTDIHGYYSSSLVSWFAGGVCVCDVEGWSYGAHRLMLLRLVQIIQVSVQLCERL